jgi:hypothetical protein
VYRIHYAPGADWQGDNVVFFFNDGPEHDARAAQPAKDIEDLGVRFQVLDTQEADSVALHRVTYPGSIDVLAASMAVNGGLMPLAPGQRLVSLVSSPCGDDSQHHQPTTIPLGACEGAIRIG